MPKLLPHDETTIREALKAITDGAKACSEMGDTQGLNEGLCDLWSRTRKLIEYNREAEERARQDALEGVK